MKKRLCIITYILIIISLLLFTYQFPYSCDDWGWATSYGINQLLSKFSNLNGRYLGNILIILISRNNIIKTCFMSGIIFLILYFGTKILKKNNLSLVLVFYAIFLIMPWPIFSQAIIWSSGFCNYAVSTLIIILVIYIILKKAKIKWPFIVYTFIGYCGSLLVENVTIYILIISILINICFYFTKKEISKHYLGLLIGSIIGTFTMFSNPSYFNLVDHTDTYRSIEINTQIIRTLISYLLFLFIIISISIISIYLKTKKFTINSNFLLMFVSTIINFLSIVLLFNKDILASKIFYFILAVFIVSYIIMFYLNRHMINRDIILIFMSILILLAPLFFVFPVGARNFLAIYILVGIIALYFIQKLITLKNKYFYLISFIIISLIYVNCYFNYGKDFKYIKKETNRVVSSIKAKDSLIIIDTQVFNTKVNLPFPFSNEVKHDFCEFYQLDEDSFRFIYK